MKDKKGKMIRRRNDGEKEVKKWRQSDADTTGDDG